MEIILQINENKDTQKSAKNSEEFDHIHKHEVYCNIICEYCEGCVDIVPKENYSCFRGRSLFYLS